ncbi:hypothetical protein ACFLU9_01145 [Chloroflexota bacterium]
MFLGWNLVKFENEYATSPVAHDHWGVFSFSDYLTMKAGERFYEGETRDDYILSNMTVGYKEFSRGWYHYQVPLTNPNSSIYYTHSGPMDGVINGILRHFGITELTRFLEINAFLITLAMGFWYVAASLLFGRAVALISLLFMGTALSTVHFASTICGHGHEWFFAFGAVMLFLLAERAPPGRVWPRILGYGGAWVLTYFQATVTNEFILWLQIFFIGYLWISRGNPLKAWKLILFMGSASVISVCVHWLIVAISFGGFNNLIADLTAGIGRRTTEFLLAEEPQFKYFNIRQTIPFLNGELKFRIGMDFIDMGILIALVLGIFFFLKRSLSVDKIKQFSAQNKLILVFLIGGFAFQAIFIQATVSQTGQMFKTVLPAAGLLIGYAAVMVFRYLTPSRKTWFVITPAILIFCIIAIPMVKERGRSFDPNQDSLPLVYYGRTQSELRILADFVKENTLYGDIILTNIAAAEAGHPRYPFPAYEYLSQRHLEISRDIPRAQQAVAELEGIRQALPETNPASEISLYLLIEEGSNKAQFGEFARSTGELKHVFDTGAWWNEHGGGVPAGERKMVFYLYKINPAQVEQWD